MNIELVDGQMWEVDGNRLTVHSSRRVATYTLPKRCRRIVVEEFGEQARLSLGGFKSNTVTVTGPLSTIEQLREGVL